MLPIQSPTLTYLETNIPIPNNMSQEDLHVELIVRWSNHIIKTTSNTSRLTMEPHEYATFENIRTALINHHGVNLKIKRRIFSSLAIEKILLMIKEDKWGYAKKSYALAKDDTEYNAAIQNWRRDSRKCVIPKCVCHQCSEFKWGLEITVFTRNRKPGTGDEVENWDVVLRAEDFRVQDVATKKARNEKKKNKSPRAGVDAQDPVHKWLAAVTDESDISSDDIDDDTPEEDDHDDDTINNDTTDEDTVDDDATDYEAREEENTDEDAMDENTTDEAAKDCVLSRPCPRVPPRT